MLDALAAIDKALLYLGLLTAVGAVLAEATLHPSPEDVRWLRGLVLRAAITLVVAAVCNVLLLFLRLGGQWDEATLSAILSSSVGAATGLQLAGALLLIVAAIDSTVSWRAMLANAAVALASFAFNGHAAAVGIVAGLVAVVHVAAAAWWLGSLLLLRYACTQWASDAVGKLVQRFSLLASRFIGALAIAGLLLIAVLVDFSREPWFTPYVRMLALKIGVALVVLTIAAYNRLRLTPRLLAGDRAAVATLARTVTIEGFLIVIVLSATAVLTTYTSPHES